MTTALIWTTVRKLWTMIRDEQRPATVPAMSHMTMQTSSRCLVYKKFTSPFALALSNICISYTVCHQRPLPSCNTTLQLFILLVLTSALVFCNRSQDI